MIRLYAAAVFVVGVVACNNNNMREQVHYIGRFTNEPSPRFAWPGSGVVARFDGTGIAVTLGGAPNSFATFIDGQPGAVIKTSSGVSAKQFIIAHDLPAGEHTVEMYRLTEGLFNPSLFGGFAVEGGALRASPEPFSHRILFVGDSISAGYGNRGELTSGCHLDIDTEDVLVAYPALTARALNAQAHIIAWSGKGIYRQYGDGDTPSTEQMPVLFERTLPTETDSTWDHAKFSPEVVVVNLGSNDWSSGDPGRPFVDAYTQFVQHLRTLYPRAEIFCTLGPMLTKSEALRYIEDVVSQSGDPHMHYFPFARIEPADGYGCDYHPSQATHRKMADELAAQVSRVMRWPVVQASASQADGSRLSVRQADDTLR